MSASSFHSDAASQLIRVRSGRELLLRSCATLDELEACVALQGAVWGYSERDVIPRRVYVVAQHIGGHVVGAFDPERKVLVGFAMALPGIKLQSSLGAEAAPPSPYLHSHMLAVAPEWRNEGLGQHLKRYQREMALAQGLTRMEWSFDPLEIKNAYLNVHRLGAIVRTYLPNFYGASTAALQGGLPTDRLIAEWALDAERVEAILSGERRPHSSVVEQIFVPAKAVAAKEKGEIDLALTVQRENRAHFERAFAAGLAVVDFRTDADGNGIYELAPWPF